MKSIVVQTFANNEIRIRFQDMQPVRRNYGDRSVDRHDAHRASAAAEAIITRAKEKGVVSYGDKDGQRYIRDKESRFDSSGGYLQSHLDITCEFQRRREEGIEARRIKRTMPRPTRFGRSARHLVLEAGAVTERRYPNPGCSTFVTLTLPGSTKRAYSTLAQWSGYVCNRLSQRLRRAYPGITWFYAWELQKRGALHLHLCLSSVESGQSMAAGQDLVGLWYKVLGDLGTKTGVDFFLHRDGDKCTAREYWQSDCEEVRKSPAAYISKYVSKGTGWEKEQKGFKIRERMYYPRRWWGMSRILRRWINECRSEIRFNGCSEDSLSHALSVLHGSVRRFDAARVSSYTFDVLVGQGDTARSLGSGHCTIYHVVGCGFDDALFWLSVTLGYIDKLTDWGSVEWRYGDPRKRGFSSGLRVLDRLRRGLGTHASGL